MAEKLRVFSTKYGVRILIVFLSMLFLCTFISRKEGFHMDEILAFQLSNAEFNPWILPTEPERRLARFVEEHIEGDGLGETLSNVGFILKDTLTNRGNGILATYPAGTYGAPVWIGAEAFRDYLRCDREDDFNFLSAYYNATDDNHPPLHFMLLHLLSSIFKGEAGAWLGCAINLVAMAGVLWLLGLIGDMVFRKRSSSLALMVLFGFSMGIVGTTIWIRMYALLTLWTVWGLYLHLRKYGQVDGDSFVRLKKNGAKAKWLGSVGIFAVTLLSFWTQYFGLFFILPMALLIVVFLAREQRRQEMWAYIRTMITAGVVGVCLYPFAIGDVLFSERGTQALGQWQNGLAEFGERLAAFWKVLGENVAGSAVVLLVVLALPPVGLAVEHYVAGGENTSKEGRMAWKEFVLCALPTVVYFLLAAKMSPYFVDRYIMAIFPITALILVWLWDAFAPKPQVVFALTIVLVVLSNVNMKGEHTYMYKGYESQLAVAKEYGDYPLVCLYPGFGFYENVMEMEQYTQTMLVKAEELSRMDEDRVAVTEQGYVVLLKYPNEADGSSQLAEVMETFGGAEAELLYQGGAFGDVLYLVTP